MQVCSKLYEAKCDCILYSFLCIYFVLSGNDLYVNKCVLLPPTYSTEYFV